jgi:hypothetical protein
MINTSSIQNRIKQILNILKQLSNMVKMNIYIFLECFTSDPMKIPTYCSVHICIPYEILSNLNKKKNS